MRLALDDLGVASCLQLLGCLLGNLRPERCKDGRYAYGFLLLHSHGAGNSRHQKGGKSMIYLVIAGFLFFWSWSLVELVRAERAKHEQEALREAARLAHDAQADELNRQMEWRG
jgi:hypothetical protein